MTISTISTTITSGVTLGTSGYGSGLTITNTGAIITADYFGAPIYGPASLTGAAVTNFGTISGTGIKAAGEFRAPATLYNHGLMSGGNGVDLAAGGTVINTGSLIGAGYGVILNGGSLLNAGDVLGSGGIEANNGAYILNTGNVVRSSTSTSYAKIVSLRSNSQLNNLGGTISSGNYAVYAALGSTIVNTGLITSTHGTVIIKDGSRLDNHGTIQGFIGVQLESNGSIANSGTIIGQSDGVIPLASMTNDGVIEGVSQFGVVFTYATQTLINHGSIFGGAAGVHGTSPVYTQHAYIYNNGLIAGTSVALDLQGTINLTLGAGASFSGAVTDEGGTGGLTLAGATHASLDMGGSFSGFSNVAFVPGAAWTLAGTKAELASGQTITGFTLGDTIILDGFSAIDNAPDNVFTPGVGVVLSTFGGPNVTLGITGSFGAGTGTVLHESVSGGNTTISAAPIVYTLATSINHALYLDHPTYGSPFTITSTGTIMAQPAQYTSAGLKIGFRPVTVTNMGAIYGATALQPPVAPGQYASSDGIQLISAADVLINNSGRVTGGEGKAGIYFAYHNTLINTGIISGGAGGTIYANGGDGFDALQVNLIINAGTIAGGAAGSGPSAASGYALRINESTLVVEPGAMFIGAVGSLTGSNKLILAGSTSGSLDMGGTFSGFDGINFAPGAAWTLEGTAAELVTGQTMTGFNLGDTIVLDGFNAISDSFVTGTGLVLSDGTTSETLAFTGNFTTSDFTISTLAQATDITLNQPAPCFCPGTRIFTARGKIPVESLNLGDLVKTATRGFQPIRWIGRRAYAGRFIAGNHLILPVKIRRHALGHNIPARDLHVSPGHAICEGGVLVHAWRLVNGVSITQAAQVERVEYFHIELDQHAVIFAENAPVESFLDNGCRAQFENAASAGAPPPAQPPCLPLIEDGYYLARLKARINTRAGIANAPAPGPLRGNLDHAGTVLYGWAQDESATETAVELELLCGGRVIQRFIANKFRADLRAANLGSGCHAFELPLPRLSGPLTIRRAADGAILGLARQQAA